MFRKVMSLCVIGLTSCLSHAQSLMPTDYFHMYDPYASLIEVKFGDPANPTFSLYYPFGMASPYGFPYTGQQNPPIPENGDVYDVPGTVEEYQTQEIRSNTAAGEDDSSLQDFFRDLALSTTEDDVDDSIDGYINDLDDLDGFTSIDHLVSPFNLDNLLELSGSQALCELFITIPQPAPFDNIFENFFRDSLFFPPNHPSDHFRTFFTPGLCPGAGCGGVLPGAMSSWGGAVPCPVHAPGHAGNPPTIIWDNLDIRYRKAVTALFLKRRAIRHQFWADINTAVTQQDFSDLIADNIYYRTIALEVPLKKAIIAGFPNVFEIGRVFRNEGVDRTHRPEFTMVEMYKSNGTIDDMRDLFIDLIYHLTGKYPEMPTYEYDDLVAKHGEDFDEHMQELCFVVGQPLEQTPLCKAREDGKADRFEVFGRGFEIANAFQEVHTADEQRERFEGKPGGADDGLIEALEYGMPPTGGMGIGIDRLVMYLLEIDNVRDAILFP